jgi:hypothetical protein
MLRKIGKRNFGLFSALKNVISTPNKHLKLGQVSTGDNNAPISHTNFAFEEVAQEWSAAIVQNTFEVNNTQNPEFIAQGNFGTLDNPHLIFTSEVPFRFVGCTGQPNEDDYEGHELMFILLREGSLQRCMGCGQVFKLIRLRQEFNAENEYYSSSMTNIDFNELGEADHWAQQSPLRVMGQSFEHTHFETNTNMVYSLVNPDDHDKFLVDPAYRLQKTKEVLDAYRYDIQVMDELEELYYEQQGNMKTNINKDNYENLVDAQIAIKELDDFQKKIQKYNLRQIYDPQNHKRREARMLERSKERVEINRTIYFDNFTERELQYMDYFETDVELEKKNILKKTESKREILSQSKLNQENYLFEEQYNGLYPDQSSIVQQKVFRFKYRQSLYPAEDHMRKENRMVSKLQDIPKIVGLALEVSQMQEGIEKSQKTLNYYNLLIEHSLNNYKNYFESDLEEDFEFFENLPRESQLEFVDSLNHEILEDLLESRKITHLSFPKENDEKGFINESLNFFKSFSSDILPLYNNIDQFNFGFEKDIPKKIQEEKFKEIGEEKTKEIKETANEIEDKQKDMKKLDK